MQFRPGVSNHIADALSRKNAGDMELGALLTVAEVDWSKLDKEISLDPLLFQIRSDLLSRAKAYTHFTVKKGQLMYKGRVVKPRKSSFIPTILHMYHNSPVGGHSGDVKTYLRIAAVRSASKAKSITASPGWITTTITSSGKSLGRYFYRLC